MSPQGWNPPFRELSSDWLQPFAECFAHFDLHLVPPPY